MIIIVLNKINIKQKDIFSIEAIKNNNDSFYLNQYIDRDFIFTTNKTIRQISYPNYLKYYGEEEIISVDAFTKGIDIYSAPTNTYEQIDNSFVLIDNSEDFHFLYSSSKSISTSFKASL